MAANTSHFPADGSALRLVDALPTGILVLGSEGMISYANIRAHELLGATLVGVPVEHVFAPIDHLWCSLDGGRQEMALTAPHTRRTMEVGFQLSVLEQGLMGPERFLLVFQDITETNRLRAERDRLLQIAAVGNVLPSILHEIKNPLASIRSSVELLVEETPDGTMREDLHAILNEIRRITLTLEGVGRIQHDLRSTRFHPIDQACLEAFAVLTAQGRDKGLDLKADVPALPLLPFDPAGFRALVFNLLTNAIQACRPGASIHLAVRLEGEALALTVTDTGKGMSPEVLARCRELFFTTRSKGTGIGLALCTSLAESAGGSLEVESAPDTGTRITVRIPTNPKPPEGGLHVQSGRSQPNPEAASVWHS